MFLESVSELNEHASCALSRISLAWKNSISIWLLYNLPGWRRTLILGVLCLHCFTITFCLPWKAHSWSACSSGLLASVQHIFSTHPFFENGSTECWTSQRIRSTHYLSIYDQTAVSCSDSLHISTISVTSCTLSTSSEDKLMKTNVTKHTFCATSNQMDFCVPSTYRNSSLSGARGQTTEECLLVRC